VAHEIRNPLTAIAQANALLDEDLTDPTQRQLSALVRQNAQRLAQIADEILSVAGVQQQGRANSVTLPLDPSVEADCADWARQTASAGRLRVSLKAGRSVVPFESDHLRRVLVNLLDNALRYAGAHADSIQVATTGAARPVGLRVWSDGPALEPGVQRHLFEPFFSSESRSSGLGLYICRELCERHGAQIGYRRGPAPLGEPRQGNEFFVDFLAATVRTAEAPPPATIGAS
jgi:two-component system sensor histidine kinase PilS (NtrC family)